MMIRNFATVLGLVAAAASFAAAAQDCTPSDATTAPTAPTAPLDEAMPLQPGPDYAWSPGHWSPECDGQYDWVGGQWILPGYSAPVRWVHGDDRWRFERDPRAGR